MYMHLSQHIIPISSHGFSKFISCSFTVYTEYGSKLVGHFHLKNMLETASGSYKATCKHSNMLIFARGKATSNLLTIPKIIYI